MAYMFDNVQYIAVAVGQSIMAFGLPDEGTAATATAGNRR
jgi:hypothetical protein